MLVGFLLIFTLVIFLCRGQDRPKGNSPPYFGPSRKMDFELEMVRVLMTVTITLV